MRHLIFFSGLKKNSADYSNKMATKWELLDKKQYGLTRNGHDRIKINCMIQTTLWIKQSIFIIYFVGGIKPLIHDILNLLLICKKGFPKIASYLGVPNDIICIHEI